MSLAYSSACLKDEWALFNNPAGLATIQLPTVAFTYDAYPGFASFNRMAALFATPAGPGVAALGIYRFGDELYNEHLVSAAFANTLGIASLGVKATYIQYNAEGFGRTTALTLSFGGIAQLTPHLAIGAHIININQPDITKHDEQESLPTVLLAGIAFTPSEKVLLTTEIEKDLAHDAAWKTGLEYKLHQKVWARTGLSIQPEAGSMGLRWKTKKFNLDYAFLYSLNLGASHQATVAYQFTSRR